MNGHDDVANGGADGRGVAAANALALIDDSRAKLAAFSDTPPARHLVFAAMMAAIVAAPALPMVARSAVLVMVFAAIVLVVRWDRQRTGMFLNGYRGGRTRRVTAATLACFVPLYAASSWLALERHMTWPSLALALVAGAVSYAGSVWWCRVFRREMLGGIA